jgi:hypothetical protein
MHDQQQRYAVHHGTEVVAFAFLGLATAVSGAQTAVLSHDAAAWRRVQEGRIVTWQHVPYLENLLALVDLAVLAVAALVLLTTFAERHRHAGWATLAWTFIVVGALLEFRLLGLRVSVGDGSTDSPLDSHYALRAHEALGATLLCLAALGAAALALQTARHRGSDGT